MAATVRPFVQCTSAATDASDWFSGQKRVIYDTLTGDVVFLNFGSANGAGTLDLFVSTDMLATSPVRLGTKPSNATSPYPDYVYAITQMSDGTLVGIGGYNNGSLVQYYYFEIRLIRAAGHVTAYLYSSKYIALPMGLIDTANVDYRADITVTTRDSSEVAVVSYQGGTTSSSYVCYTGYIEKVGGQPVFYGLDGVAGTATLVINRSNGAATNNHSMQFLINVEPTSGLLVVFEGSFSTDGYMTVSGSQYDLRAYTFARSGSYWSTTSTLVTIVSFSSGDMPELLNTFSVPGKCCLMSYDGTNGVSIGYFDSSATWVPNWRQVLAANNRSHFGAFGLSSDGVRSYAYVLSLGVNEASPSAFWQYHDGTSATNTTDSSPVTVESLGSSGNYNGGLIVYQGRGSSLGQTATSRYLGMIYVPAPTVTLQPSNVTVQSGSTATFTYAATASSGTLTAQVQRLISSTWTDVAGATNTTTYSLSGVSGADDGAQFRVKFGDVNDTTYSNVATLKVAALGTPMIGAIGAGPMGAAPFSLSWLRPAASTPVSITGVAYANAQAQANLSLMMFMNATASGAASAVSTAIQSVTLGAIASGNTSGVGGISLAQALAAVGYGSSSASAAVLQSVAVSGVASAVSNALGVLSAASSLAGIAYVQAGAQSSLAQARPVSGTAYAQAGAQSSLAVSIPLQVVAGVNASGIASLQAGTLLSGFASAQASGTATLVLGQTLQAIALGTARGSAGLSTGSALSGFATGSASVSLTLAMSTPLTGIAAAQSSAQGGLSLTQALLAFARGQATGSATVNISIPIAGTAGAVSTVSGSVSFGTFFTALAQASATGAGSLKLSLPITGTAGGVSGTLASLEVLLPISGFAAASSNMVGTLSIPVDAVPGRTVSADDVYAAVLADKGPNDRLDYTLTTADVGAISVASVVVMANTAESPLSVSNVNVLSSTAGVGVTFWLSGGEVGAAYLLRFLLTAPDGSVAVKMAVIEIVETH